MGESSEARIDFIAEFTLKSLRLKPDKWARMTVSDEQRSFITSFIERGVISVKRETQDVVIEIFFLFSFRISSRISD